MLSETAVKILSSLVYRPDAQWLVNVLPFGSVYWEDELPDIRQLVRYLEQDHAEIRRMFSIRLELWDGKALSDDDKELWDLVRAQVPTWPLFRRLELTDEHKRAGKKPNQNGLSQDRGGSAMPKKRKHLRGTVEKVIKSDHSPEKAQIAIHEAEDLYREIRVENELTDGDGTKVRLRQGAQVDVIVEADSDATVMNPTTPDKSNIEKR